MNKTVIAYVPESSPVYRFHPATRLVFFVVMGFVPLFISRPLVNGLVVLGFVGLFWVSRVNLLQLRMYVPMLVTVGLFIFLTYVFFPGKMAHPVLLARIGPIPLWQHPLSLALAAYVRILALLAASLYYFYTNRERDILVAFRKFRVPFLVTYFIGLTLRVAGMFIEDFHVIREAQLARGLDVTSMGFFRRIQLYAMYMVPMLAIALRRGDEITNALFAKGFSLRPGQRTDYLLSKMPWRASDTLVTVGLVAAGGLVAWLGLSTHSL
ncbi:MAG: energy-coupling factor transporter transmembrane component T [Thermaerobacter sp.]|nr:energy-coupling factor transporter transmembrane component T [Thermaerobacter sp.]